MVQRGRIITGSLREGTSPPSEMSSAGSTIVGKGSSFALRQVRVASVFEDGTARLYVNGQVEATVVVAMPENAEPVVIGAGVDGLIDEIRIYGKARTSGEIETEIVASAATPKLWQDAHLPATLVLGSGSTVTAWNDRSGNDNHATSVLAPSFVSDSALAGSAVRFDTSRLDFPSAAIPAASEYSVIASFSRRDARDEGYFLTSGPASCNSVNACWHAGYTTQTILNLAQYGNDLTVTVPGYAQPAAEIYLGQLHATGRIVQLTTASSTYVNTDTSNAKLTDGAGHLGYAVAQNQCFKGDLGEVLIYHRALTAAQREGLVSYLRAKWFP